jgi:nucleoside-diphosphate-sugar epimerase
VEKCCGWFLEIMKSLVFGAGGTVGSYIIRELENAGEPPWWVSRQPFKGWIRADLARPSTLDLPRADVIFCAANARVFAEAIPAILRSPPRRVVVITSTSVFSTGDSRDKVERQSILELIEAEERVRCACSRAGVEWTILRPTLIFDEGRDRNITQIARLVRRFGFMPLYSQAHGLRQPVHVEDLARGAIPAARTPAAINQDYCTNGAGHAVLPRHGRPHLRCSRTSKTDDFASSAALERSFLVSESAVA